MLVKNHFTTRTANTGPSSVLPPTAVDQAQNPKIKKIRPELGPLLLFGILNKKMPNKYYFSSPTSPSLHQ